VTSHSYFCDLHDSILDRLKLAHARRPQKATTFILKKACAKEQEHVKYKCASKTKAYVLEVS